MRYPASEKLEIIRLVEQSYLPIKQTLGKLGIARTTFYRWYDRYQVGGPEALEDQSPRPSKPTHAWALARRRSSQVRPGPARRTYLHSRHHRWFRQDAAGDRDPGRSIPHRACQLC